MGTVLSPLPAIGRFLIALIFVRAGMNKLGAIAATAAQMGGRGILYPDMLVWGAVVVELGGGLMLIAGLYARWVAAVLFLYTLSLALTFHAYWNAPAATARTEASFFFGHLSMIGGMLYVVAFGAGPYSIDSLMGRWRDPAVGENRV